MIFQLVPLLQNKRRAILEPFEFHITLKKKYTFPECIALRCKISCMSICVLITSFNLLINFHTIPNLSLICFVALNRVVIPLIILSSILLNTLQRDISSGSKFRLETVLVSRVFFTLLDANYKSISSCFATNLHSWITEFHKYLIFILYYIYFL